MFFPKCKSMGANDLRGMVNLDLRGIFLIGSFSFLQVTRTTIKAWMSSDFSGIPPLKSELAALEC